MTTFWCESAVIPDAAEAGESATPPGTASAMQGRVAAHVTVEVIDGRIAAVTTDSPCPPGAHRLAGLVIPGLANAHSHAFHRALRARTQADRGTFWTWRDVMYAAAARLDPDRYYALARATYGEMLLAGFTAVGEFHYLHHDIDGRPYRNANEMGEALVAAARDAGVRITLLDTLYLYGGIDGGRYVEPAGAQRRYSDGSVDAWIDRCSAHHSTDPGVRFAAAIHSIRAVDTVSLRRVASWAGSGAAELHAHVSEQTAENDACRAAHGRSPVEVLSDSGVLGPRFTAVHATHLTAGDVSLLGASGSSVCFCPTTERDLADGIGPSGLLVDAGVPLCLGSDSHAVIDGFEEMRAIELDERLSTHRRGTHTAASLLTMGGPNGHRSLGWSDAGRLAPGYRADLVAVALDSVRTAGAGPSHALETVVFAAGAADVRTVVVDGRVVVDDGHHVDIDVAAHLADAINDVFDR